MPSLICKTVKGRSYWYIVESKRVNGKVKQVVIEYIGNQKKLGERLLSGDRINDMNRMDSMSIKSYAHGDVYALMKMADVIGVQNILDHTLKSRTRDGVNRSTSLLLAAIHRAADPGSKSEFSRWFESTTLPYQLGIRPQAMTSQHFWEQMDGISEEELWAAEDAITSRILERYDVGLDKIALDYTNYFTYINSGNEKSSLAKRGRNKQKRYDLRQCSLAVVTSKEIGTPLFSHVYEGNRNDQSEFEEYTRILEKRMPGLNSEETTLVFDGGSNTKKNLESLRMHYICSFSLSYCKELYQVDLADYYEIELEGRKVKVYRITKNIWGQDRECILTFSPALYEGQLRELNGNIEQALCDLHGLNDKIKNPKSRISKTEESLLKRAGQILKCRHMAEIIRVKVKQDEVVYEIDENSKKEIIYQYFGKKLLITDRKDWSTEEIIGTYYKQDCIEKLFRDTKNTEHFSMRPIYHWTDQKIRVHIFICLLGLTLTTILQREIQQNGIRISKNQLMEELLAIKESWIKDQTKEKRVVRKMEEMNSLQTDLWRIIEKL